MAAQIDGVFAGLLCCEVMAPRGLSLGRTN
jgi:hypothetical protein